MNKPVITLLSDMGTNSSSIAVVKATFMSYAPGAAILDISHNVDQYDLQQAAYLLSAAYAHFPKGTIHVVPFDVFRGIAPRAIVLENEGYFFVAPDNGILTLAFGAQTGDTRLCIECGKPYAFKEWINATGQVIETLIKVNGISHFSVCEVKNAPRTMQPKVKPDGVECNILYIDRYENVSLDIKREQFDAVVKDRPFKIKISREQVITAISNNYNDVSRGKPLCRFNAAGYLEIAFNHDKAASFLGLNAYLAGNLQYQTIKILF